MAMSASSSNMANPYAALISQEILTVPSFTLESGVELTDVPVAYKTWGKLNATRDNCIVICHALTGSADVEDWWGPLLGPNRAFDPTRFFVFCANTIGSPYGTVSSVTINPATGRPYGPEMPGSSVKDDVRLHYLVLRHLGVDGVAAVIGGSMGGMTTLEWPLNSPAGYVRAIVALATSARHSAWCISWGEAQRQSIYSDPEYRDGYYYEVPGEGGQTTVDLLKQPARGLAAARMAALLTYRSRDSFESRFGRKTGTSRAASKVPPGGVRIMGGPETTDPLAPGTAELEHGHGHGHEHEFVRSPAWRAHNDGHRPSASASAAGSASGRTSRAGSVDGDAKETPLTSLDLGIPGGAKLGTGGERPPKVFNAQSYLRYQGDKFTSRFDANCYIHITRKLDTHDLSHPSSFGHLSSTLPAVAADADDVALERALHHALSLLPPALVIGIESDGLFQPSEQKELAAHIPDAELVLIPSPDGHDGFLLEFEAINGWVEGWLRRKVPEYYDAPRLIGVDEWRQSKDAQDGFAVKKESVFGEAEADVTRW
ncbi:L-homoserine-O-acetyltransferase [Cryptotrichosporon argae]